MVSPFTGGRLKPCVGCPWRVGNAGASVPDLAAHESMAHLFDGSQGFREVMACHLTGNGEQAACVGYVLSDHGFDNLTVRFAAVSGGFEPTQLDADGELHHTYGPMRAALDEHWSSTEGARRAH